MEQGSITIQRLIGEWPVYPGHPLVLATAIMNVFANFEEANAPSGNGFCQALGDSRIPGAGDHVSAAMGVLALGAAGRHAEQMVEAAVKFWESGQAGGHMQSVEAGRLQAEQIRPHFEASAKQWFA